MQSVNLLLTKAQMDLIDSKIQLIFKVCNVNIFLDIKPQGDQYLTVKSKDNKTLEKINEFIEAIISPESFEELKLTPKLITKLEKNNVLNFLMKNYNVLIEPDKENNDFLIIQGAESKTNQAKKAIEVEYEKYTKIGPLFYQWPNMDDLRKKTSELIRKTKEEKVEVKENKDNETESKSSNLRCIIIDGSNVAIQHGKSSGKSIGKNKVFSCQGIQIAVDYFLERGHRDIKVFVPKYRRANTEENKKDIEKDTEKYCPTLNPEILDKLEDEGFLIYTPSKIINNVLIIPYDDRFIIRAASYYNAVVISNDLFRDLWDENEEWRKTIEENVLQFTFVKDLFMATYDPHGRNGPILDEFLSKEYEKKSSTWINQIKFNNNNNYNNIRNNQNKRN